MVLAEAMAAGVPIVAAESGAIAEVTARRARLFSPGDWVGLASLLADTLEQVRGPRVPDSSFSTTAAAGRIAAAYEELLEWDAASSRS